jgi:hypothetical protein
MIGKATTWGDVFSLMKELEDVSVQQGMLFWMRDGVPPLYENHANIKGGCYSLRVSRQRSVHFFMLYTVASMLGKAVGDSANLIQGISISPKRILEKNQSFNVIKIWNNALSSDNSNSPKWIKEMPVEYEQLWESLTTDEKNRIVAQSKMYRLDTPYQQPHSSMEFPAQQSDEQSVSSNLRPLRQLISVTTMLS